MNDTPAHPDTGRPGGEPREPGRWYVVLPAAAFVAGLLLGGGLVWVGRSDDGSVRSPTVPLASESASSSAATGTTVEVPADCLAAAETVEETLEVLRRSVDAVRDLRSGELVDLLDRLEDLDGQARQQAEACRAVEVASAATPGSSPSSSAP